MFRRSPLDSRSRFRAPGMTIAISMQEWRHCEERSDEAIQSRGRDSGLLRFARNDGLSLTRSLTRLSVAPQSRPAPTSTASTPRPAAKARRAGESRSRSPRFSAGMRFSSARISAASRSFVSSSLIFAAAPDELRPAFGIGVAAGVHMRERLVVLDLMVLPHVGEVIFDAPRDCCPSARTAGRSRRRRPSPARAGRDGSSSGPAAACRCRASPARCALSR